jgi:hypothetical protein
MSMPDQAPKSQRLGEFFRRLAEAPACSDFESAYYLVCSVLNSVEDQWTGIPYLPEQWQSDGRLYPPQLDNMRDMPEHPRVKRFRSVAHNTYISDDGAIEIRHIHGEVLFSKLSANGKGVWSA